jgi:cation diffusion facilitator family transporter
MKVRQPYKLPADKRKKLEKAKRLEWITLGFMLSIVVVMGLAMGSSQAMYSAWIEDCLSFIPPIAFLIAVKVSRKQPNEDFPYGYHRAFSIAFLVAAVTLTAFGGFLLADAVMTLIMQEHPTIGIVEVFGWRLWLGWLMIGALCYSAIPPFILGRMKLSLAEELHEKVLYTDAEMNKADWLTALAGILGILGIGIGWWWADSVAAGIISFDILWDGLKGLKTSVFDLMDKKPTLVGSDETDPLPEKLRKKLEDLEWVAEARVRLREEGDVYAGEVYLVPKETENLLENLEAAEEIARSFHWRISDIVVTPVRKIEQ